MAPLKRAAAAIFLALGSPAQAETVATWRPYISEASLRFGVPSDWIERVIHAESRGRTRSNGRPIRSSAGAMGLMQLMPSTWEEMRARLRLGNDPDDPRDNILAGTLYLRLMYDRFGYPGLFGAYNAGPGRYADHLAGKRPLPGETIGYLASVAPDRPASAQATPPVRPSADRLFAVRKLQAASSGSPVSPQSSPIFVALSQGN